LRLTRPEVAFDDAADPRGEEAVPRPHEARQGRLDHHRQADGDLAGADAETVRSRGRLRADLEDGDVVRQLDGHLRRAVRPDLDVRVEVRHGLEVAAHGGAVEQA